MVIWIDGERKPLIGGKDPSSKNWNKRRGSSSSVEDREVRQNDTKSMISGWFGRRASLQNIEKGIREERYFDYKSRNDVREELQYPPAPEAEKLTEGAHSRLDSDGDDDRLPRLRTGPPEKTSTAIANSAEDTKYTRSSSGTWWWQCVCWTLCLLGA